MICDSLNRVRTTQTICAKVLHTLDSDMCPLVCKVAGSWSMETGEQFWGKTAVDCRRGVKGTGVRKFAAGNAFGGKLSSQGSGSGGPTTVAFLSPRAGTGRYIIEKDQPGWPFECQLPEARKDS